MKDMNTTGVSIHRGFPNPAADGKARFLDLNQLLVRNSASTFLMRIEGDEWNGAGIYSGDIAIVDRALTPRKTDLVAWWEGGTFAVSLPSKMAPQAEIWGVVTSVIHRYRSKS